MKVCIPVEQDLGLESPVCAHFGSAPIFMIVETESRTCRAIQNQNEHHGHGQCQPLRALAGESIDGMVVGGIGMGAVAKLAAAGVSVFQSTHGTVGETLDALAAGTLPQVTPATACGGHGHGDGGCQH